MPEPVRSCVVTRRRHERDELVRLVAAPDGSVVVDYKARLPGRGAWITPSREVLQLLDKKRRALEKALDVSVDVDHVRAAILEAVLKAAGDGLSMAAASGSLVGGRDRMEIAIREERVALIAVADDAAERTLKAITRAGEVDKVQLPWSAAELGTRLGRPPLAAVGILHGARNRYVLRQLRRLAALG